MNTETVRPGQYFYTSWGYDQTQIDYICVVRVSPSGKICTCRMAHKIHLGEYGTDTVVMPGDLWGVEFPMRIRLDGTLRGSYPYADDQRYKRLDTFTPVYLGETKGETMSMFGH